MGASGATLELGNALEKAGHDIEYFGFDHAFPNTKQFSVKHEIMFPWVLASFLNHNASRFDILDISTGDNWVWASTRQRTKREQVLITRSHGLEHAVDHQIRKSAREGEIKLSWKYPLYHGGYRLWQVKKSLQLADHNILLNEVDRDYICCKFGVPPEKVSIHPNGISAGFLDLKQPQMSQRLSLAFVGNWITRKGNNTLIEATNRLQQSGLDFTLSFFGTGVASDMLLKDFASEMQERIQVQSRFSHELLPSFLVGHDILLFPSLVEGFGMALIEAMACGLAPITTPVGVAPSVITSDLNGILFPVGDAAKLADAVKRLASDLPALLKMRNEAQKSAQAYTWEAIAQETVSTYTDAILGQRGLLAHA